MITSFNRRFVPKSKRGELTEAVVGRLLAEENAVKITPIRAAELLGMQTSDSPTFKTMHVTPLVTLDPVEVNRCFDMLNEGVPRACMQRLNAELTRAGFLFFTNDGEYNAVGEMQNYIDNVLKQLQQDAIRAICAIGVCPMAFRRDEMTGLIIPYVPAPKTYTISIGTVRGVRFYQLQWLSLEYGGTLLRERQRGARGNRHDDRLVASRHFGDRVFGVPDPSVVVMHGFNNDPDVDGTIRSLVSSFIRRAVVPAQRFTDLAVVAEAINAKPPLARQYDGKTDAAVHESLRGTEYVGEGVLDPIGENDARRINNQYLRTEAQIAAYQRQNKEIATHMATLAGEPVDESGAVSQVYPRHPRSVSATDAEGNPMPWQTEVALPEQWKVAPLQLPQPRGDLVPLLTHFNEQVFLAFLIPGQSLNANARLSADADMAEKTLDVVVSQWKRDIARVLTFGHDSSYLAQDINTAVESTAKRNRERAGDGGDRLRLHVTDEELDEIMATVGTLRISYRMKPPAKQADLDVLYARGVIDWATYTAASCAIAGIDPTLAQEKDPLAVEARRVVGMPTYIDYLKWKQDGEKEENRHGEAEATREQQAELTRETLEQQADQANAALAAQDEKKAKKKAKKSK
jgi:hypothetical protein